MLRNSYLSPQFLDLHGPLPFPVTDVKVVTDIEPLLAFLVNEIFEKHRPEQLLLPFGALFWLLL